MEKINALIIFCEGAHDVAFCRLAFKYHFNINKINWKFSEYPSPLNQLFQTSITKHAAKDMSLDMAHKFFLPDKTLYSKEKKNLILLFNTGGKTKTDNPKKFLGDFIPLLKQAEIFPDSADKIIKSCNYLFLYDRDYKKESEILSWHNKQFEKIDDETSISEKEKKIYLFSKSNNTGTLENMLLPMLKETEENLTNKGEQFIDDCFTWHTKKEDIKIRTAEIAKRKKSIITVIGQRKKPGSSMNVIIDQAKLIPQKTFINNEDVKKFVSFVKGFAKI
jgi:hypothetical protein